MKMLSLKKVGIWLVLVALTSTQGVYADFSGICPCKHIRFHHCKRPISRSERVEILNRGRADWNRIISNLNEIFLVEGLTGLTPAIDTTIAALVAALNGSATQPGSIFQASADFRALLQELSVPTETATNVELAINAYVEAAELYSGAVATGTPDEQTAAFNAWLAQGLNLANALEVAIGVLPGSTSLNTLINELITAQILVIQNFNTSNPAASFAVAVENQAISHELANQISDLVVESLIDSLNHKACRR